MQKNKIRWFYIIVDSQQRKTTRAWFIFQGENKFIESLCQTIVPVEELLWVLNHDTIDPNLKQPFVKYMIWVYLKPAVNLVESGAADLQHSK